VRDGCDVPIRQIEVSVYTIPTDAPESDGTLEWDSTTLVLVSAFAGNQLGIGPFIGSFTPNARIPLDTGLCGAAATSGQVVVVQDVSKDTRYLSGRGW
jgi:putative methionine-R-sulfoxide reductase with GAF domain